MKKSVFLPNLIKHTKFPFSARKKGFNILLRGRICYMKNIPLALSMLHELVKLDRRYTLHIVGNCSSDAELPYYFGNFIMKTKLHDNVRFYSWVDNDKLPKFMKNMHYILCSSISESQGVGILEAMCYGLKPVIFDFPGADQMYSKEWIWIDFEQFKGILDSGYNPSLYSDFAMTNHSIERNIYRYRYLINDVLHEDK